MPAPTRRRMPSPERPRIRAKRGGCRGRSDVGAAMLSSRSRGALGALGLGRDTTSTHLSFAQSGVGGNLDDRWARVRLWVRVTVGPSRLHAHRARVWRIWAKHDAALLVLFSLPPRAADVPVVRALGLRPFSRVSTGRYCVSSRGAWCVATRDIRTRSMRWSRTASIVIENPAIVRLSPVFGRWPTVSRMSPAMEL